MKEVTNNSSCWFNNNSNKFLFIKQSYKYCSKQIQAYLYFHLSSIKTRYIIIIIFIKKQKKIKAHYILTENKSIGVTRLCLSYLGSTHVVYLNFLNRDQNQALITNNSAYLNLKKNFVMFIKPQRFYNKPQSLISIAQLD